MDLSARSPATESLVADAVKLAEPWFPRGPASRQATRADINTSIESVSKLCARNISRVMLFVWSTFISQMMWKSCGKTEHRCRNAAAENELTLSQKVRIEIEVCTEKRH